MIINFKYHLDDNLPEQDVFVERGAGGQVFRVGLGEHDLKVPLYATRGPIPHNPFSADAIGPYEKGRSLGLDLGDWLSAKGEASYVCEDNQGTLEASFEHLVPKGVYTLWHFFMAMPPTSPFIGTYDLPVGERDGSQSVLHADAEGRATFRQQFHPCLQLSGEHLASGLALAWHSDGKTYGVEPGGFGQVSHVQMYAFLPKRAGF